MICRRDLHLIAVVNRKSAAEPDPNEEPEIPAKKIVGKERTAVSGMRGNRAPEIAG